MTIYLDENQLGDDRNCIGFPNLMSCMALVVMTDRNLYGAHLALPGEQSDAVVPALADLIAAHHAPADMKALYGCCDRKARYQGSMNKKRAWKAEMRRHAQQLNFNGNIYGFCTSIVSPYNGTYVEYFPDYIQNKCRVYYKRNEKMNYVKNYGPSNVQFHSPYTGLTANANLTTINASIIATDGNRGRIHDVNYFLRMTSFFV